MFRGLGSRRCCLHSASSIQSFMGKCLHPFSFQKNSIFSWMSPFIKGVLLYPQRMNPDFFESIKNFLFWYIILRLGIVWGVSTPQYEQAFRTWTQPCQGPQSLRSLGKQGFFLDWVWMLTSYAEGINYSFLLLGDCSLRKFPYRDPHSPSKIS